MGEPSSLTGEGSSRSDLRLPGDQEALINAIAATGKPFAVVLINGRPLVVSDWIDRAPTVLQAWHLGTQGPEAIARILTGAANPGGRLPMSYPRAAGQIPVHYDHENTGRPALTGGSLQQDEVDIGLHGPDNVDDRFTSKYRDLPLGPQFRFGHGLSYTTFRYGTPTTSASQLSLDELRAGQVITVDVPVTNTGDRAGDEVVQLYVRDPVASLAQPVRRLRGFHRDHPHPRAERPSCRSPSGGPISVSGRARTPGTSWNPAGSNYTSAAAWTPRNRSPSPSPRPRTEPVAGRLTHGASRDLLLTRRFR